MADQPEDPRPQRGAGSDDPGQPAPLNPIGEEEAAADRTQPLPEGRDEPLDPIRDDEADRTQPLPDDAGQPLDQTAPFDPIRDDEAEADRTRPLPNGAGQPLDRTAPFDPIRDDEDDDAPAAAAETQRLPDDPDRTARIDRTADDRTTEISAADRTTRIQRSSARNGTPPDDRTTRIQPQSGPRNATPPSDRAWAGRAGIPQPGGPGGPPDDGPPRGDWQPGDGGGRRWWMPILVGIIALILLGVLAFGLWLILRGDGGTPAPTTTSSAPAPTTAAPTTVAPTTSAPSPTATTPAAVEVPVVKGRSVLDAGQLLSDAGLPARLNYVASDEPAGTVVGSDPEAGTEVQPGTTVTLEVSLGPTTAPTTPPVTSTPTTPPVVPPGP